MARLLNYSGSFGLHKTGAIHRRQNGEILKVIAQIYGISATAVRDWERKRRMPEKAARTLLMLIDQEPQEVERVLIGV